MNPNRRQFLRRTVAAATVFGTVGSATGTAAAYHGPPYVSTRGHFDDDANLTPGHTTTGYDTSGDVPGVDAGCAGDVAVFAHGWHKKGDDAPGNAQDKMSLAAHQLDANGYSGTTVGYTWDNDAGGGWDFGWGTAKEVAQQNGAKLAQFALDYKLACPSGTIRFVCHSLGAQVVLSTLRHLDANATWNYYGYEVETVHLLGAAQDNEAPTTEWIDTYNAILDQTGHTYNYYSEDDDVLEWVYNVIEFDQALGETGAEAGNTTPSNYTDFDATSQVGHDHSSYFDDVSDEMVVHMGSV